MLYLILLPLWFHKVFNIIFPRLSSWPKTMYAEHWRKLPWTTFLGNFPVLLIQQFCGILINSCLLEYAIVFPIKNKFWFFFFFFAFYSDLVPPFYFVKWNRFFSTIIPVLSESRHYSNYLLSREVCTNLHIKTFPLVKLWYTIWMYGGSEFQKTISKSTHLILILLEIAWVEIDL